MKQKSTVWKRLKGLVASDKFFWGVLILLVLQSAWIALSGRYPMAFDEDFHLGIIKLYAHHLSPFWGSQPEGADVFGAVSRDPSYLYQYLMSFPYRLISLFTRNQTIIVLVLRGLNIALLTVSLPLYRRLLMKTGAPRAIIHLCCLIFILLPIVPLLAAQINYDNLVLPLTALTLLVAVRASEQLSRSKRLDIKLISSLVVICLLGSLVKYAFLPIFLGVGVFLVIRLKQTFSGWQVFRSSARKSFGLVLGWQKLALLICLLLAAGLFSQRYGVNLARYHEPLPNCREVLSVAQCSEYGPWARDYNLALAKVSVDSTKNPLTFTGDWSYALWLRTYFSVDGPGTAFQTRGPLRVPAISAIAFAAVAAVSVLIYRKSIWRKYQSDTLWLFVIVSVFYIGALWFDEYRVFIRTGQAVAINGRYLLPVVLPLISVGALGLSELLKNHINFKMLLAGLFLACSLWGGGALTYILRSNNDWYWPNSAVRGANHAVQDIIGPLTPGYRSPIQFL